MNQVYFVWASRSPKRFFVFTDSERSARTLAREFTKAQHIFARAIVIKQSIKYANSVRETFLSFFDRGYSRVTLNQGMYGPTLEGRCARPDDMYKIKGYGVATPKAALVAELRFNR